MKWKTLIKVDGGNSFVDRGALAMLMAQLSARRPVVPVMMPGTKVLAIAA